MNFVPSDFPRLSGAASLSKPGFDILLAVSAARQATLPTTGVLRARTSHDSHAELSAARRAILCGTAANSWAPGLRPVRFFDLSEEVTALSETVNSLFTRVFQPMLNSSTVDIFASGAPLPDGEKVE